MKKTGFYVIGGQYDDYCFGHADTLIGAKRIATKNEYYCDNWQGWAKPMIYPAEECEMATNFFGRQPCPKYGARGWCWDSDSKRWEEWRA